MAALQIHPSINFERVMGALVTYLRLRWDGTRPPYPGFCLCCGWENTDGVSEDDHGFLCELCDEPAVYGAMQLLLATHWVHDGQDLAQGLAETPEAALAGVLPARSVP